jgi:hypothetical protein
VAALLSPEVAARVTSMLSEFPAVIHQEEEAEDGLVLTVWLVEADDVEGFRAHALSVLKEAVGVPEGGAHRL